MRKFRALFKSVASNENMLILAFRFRGIVKPASDRKMKTGFWRTWEFSLTDEEIAAIKAGWQGPSNVPAVSDGAVEAIEAYFRTEIPYRDHELIRVDEITGPMPADAETKAEEWRRLRKVQDHGENCPCPEHRPGNPQLSDPWARGW